MLRILTIHGSPHQGQTYATTMEFLKALGDRIEIEVQHVFLSREQLAFCRGCGVCVTHGEDGCPNQDGVRGIHAAIQDADAVIITTPVYALQVTALVKSFLERSSYIMHRPCYFGKWFMPVTTQFYSGDKDVEKYLASVMHFWGFNVLPGLRVTMSQDTDAIRSRIIAAADRFRKIGTRARCPVPAWRDFMMFRLRRSMVDAKSFKDLFPRDAEYFKEKGWLGSDYYYAVRLDPLMKGAGKILDAMGRTMMRRNERRQESA